MLNRVKASYDSAEVEEFRTIYMSEEIRHTVIQTKISTVPGSWTQGYRRPCTTHILSKTPAQRGCSFGSATSPRLGWSAMETPTVFRPRITQITSDVEERRLVKSDAQY